MPFATYRYTDPYLLPGQRFSTYGRDSDRHATTEIGSVNPFGRFYMLVNPSTSRREIRLPTAADAAVIDDDKFNFGILLDTGLYETVEVPNPTGEPSTGYGECREVDGARKGDIPVELDEGLSITDLTEDVFVRIDVGANGDRPGVFTNDADGGTAVLLPGAKWHSVSQIDGIGVVSIELPQ